MTATATTTTISFVLTPWISGKREQEGIIIILRDQEGFWKEVATTNLDICRTMTVIVRDRMVTEDGKFVDRVLLSDREC